MTDNSKKHKFISLIWLSYCAFVIFLGDFIPIEFASSTLKNIYYIIIYLSIPIIFIWTTIIILKIHRPAIFITTTTIISVFILLIVGLKHTMCGAMTEVLFKNKNDAATIVRRSYGCGAWDSDMPVYTYHKIVPMTPVFNIVTSFDIENIDKNVWIQNGSNQTKVDYFEKAALEKAAASKGTTK